MLKNNNYYILEVKAIKKKIGFIEKIKYLQGLNSKELVFFIRQFSVLINSGLTLIKTLFILEKQLINQD